MSVAEQVADHAGELALGDPQRDALAVAREHAAELGELVVGDRLGQRERHPLVGIHRLDQLAQIAVVDQLARSITMIRGHSATTSSM